MSTHLTTGQRAWLEAELVQRQHALDRQLREHHGGLTRAEHAAAVLAEDRDDAAQHEAERELDLALSDRELRESGAVSDALRRLRDGAYGRCSDCEADIPFDRLKAEPWALRCVACETVRERQQTAGRR